MNKNLSRLIVALVMLLPGLPAWSAMSCSILSNPAQAKVIYNYWPAADLLGALDVTCTRDPNNDDRKPTIWIGLTQTTTGRTATLDTGGSTVGYEIFHGSYTAGTWTNTGGVAPGSNTSGAVSERLDFGNRGSSLTESYTFYLRVPLLQIKPAGVYLDTVPLTLRLDNAGGPILATATLPVYISIPRSCRFSTPPSGINVNYPAFSTSAVTGTSNFALTCTQGTTYTIALDRTSSVVPTVELRYGLTLSATSATGIAVAQPYAVNISVDPGQAGRCSGGTCTGTDTRTLTVTY